MPKTVLIARPHTFIVATMKPFLEECGYDTRKLENIATLPAMVNGAAGAVVSLALSSSVAQSAEEVFLELRRTAPAVPVLFASMLTFELARSGLERIAKQAGIQANILGVDAAPAAAAQLGRQESFLYISKDDLASPARRALALRLIQRHFR